MSAVPTPVTGEAVSAGSVPADSNEIGRTVVACPVCGKTHTAGPHIVCPMCGLTNAPDAIFCANDACHKALGDFRYVREELQPPPGWHEALADRVTAFIGKPRFYLVHAGWLILWVIINTGLAAFMRSFDVYPFSLLGILLTAEALFISGFVLISQNRQNDFANKRAELDYEVNVRTYREIENLEKWVRGVDARLARLEANRSETNRSDADGNEANTPAPDADSGKNWN